MARCVDTNSRGLSPFLKWDVSSGLRGSILSVLWGGFHSYTYIKIRLMLNEKVYGNGDAAIHNLDKGVKYL
jgi:hypothetical protein